MFKVVEREQTLASRVTGQVEQLLVEELLQPGDRLPAERDLAAKFSVSRTVVREAVRSLAAKGMLEVRQGRGTIVRTPTVETLRHPLAMMLRGGNGGIDYHKVIEVRRLLEVEIAGMAAERRTEADLETLQRILDDVAGIRDNRKKFASWDVAFHSALARATQNELFSLLLESVSTVMRQIREVGFEVPGTPDRALHHHTAILAQVRKGDADGARAAMRSHLGESEQTMQRALRLKQKARK